jgi:hypothetical protein
MVLTKEDPEIDMSCLLCIGADSGKTRLKTGVRTDALFPVVGSIAESAPKRFPMPVKTWAGACKYVKIRPLLVKSRPFIVISNGTDSIEVFDALTVKYGGATH